MKTEIIEPLDLSMNDAAWSLGITTPALSTFLNEHAPLSADMALRVEKAFGVSVDTLTRMQDSYNIAEAMRALGELASTS